MSSVSHDFIGFPTLHVQETLSRRALQLSGVPTDAPLEEPLLAALPASLFNYSNNMH